MNNYYIQQVFDVIKKSRKIAISGHIDADLDSIGSTLAMYEICLQIANKHNKEITVLPIAWEKSEILDSNLPHVDKVMVLNQENIEQNSIINNIDLMILVDIGTFQRAPITKLLNINRQILTIVIDHHIDSCINHLKDINLMINYVSRSTTKIIYKEFLESKNNILKCTRSLAHNILAGICGDTDFLSDTNITSNDFKIVAKLLDLGANFDDLIIKFKRSVSLKKIKAKSIGILDIKIQDKYAYCALCYEKILEIELLTGYKLEKHDIVNEMRCIENIDFGIVILEKNKNFLTASLRSRTNDVDVEKIAKHFGGGGHKTSAAFRFETKNFIKSVEEIINFCNSYR
ncbi:MAG: DHH family phosphoesterase [Candidatus Dojkabacteria bacterium]|nr:DHH family phosphoesterase [Candidatus Dojkabacteria bacterium]